MDVIKRLIKSANFQIVLISIQTVYGVIMIQAKSCLLMEKTTTKA